jgi:hypothetical protein
MAETIYKLKIQFIYSTKLNVDIVIKKIDAERKGE